jgi:glycosyltransferase involved in cell wall biosynthesis
LLKEGKRVGFDLEDWYSEDLLPASRRKRPLRLLKKIEASALHHGTYCITTSQAMATAMATEYGCREPEVIYNAFSLAERSTEYQPRAAETKKVSLHWFSQTIGPGRGLEKLLDALRYVTRPLELHLRGEVSKSYQEELHAAFPWSEGHELYIHPLVSPQDLVVRIADYQIGLALEEDVPPSRNLTVTNKILQYLLAGIPVIASDTEGQQEIARQAPGAVWLFANDNPTTLADRITELSQTPDKLRAAGQAALEAARNIFCWEKEEEKLLRIVEAAL